MPQAALCLAEAAVAPYVRSELSRTIKSHIGVGVGGTVRVGTLGDRQQRPPGGLLAVMSLLPCQQLPVRQASERHAGRACRDACVLRDLPHREPKVAVSADPL